MNHSAYNYEFRLCPACLFTNTEFFQEFEKGLNIAHSIILKRSPEFNVAESLLKLLSENKENKPKELLIKRIDNFILLPEEDCEYNLGFNPLINAPNEAMFFSLDDIKKIVSVFRMALDRVNNRDFECISSVYRGFTHFLSYWIKNAKQTGSYFGERIRIQ